jgi:hypothetical protein
MKRPLHTKKFVSPRSRTHLLHVLH